MDPKELENRFVSHNMNYGQVSRSNDFRQRFITLAQEINLAMPDSREKATALTKLEECSFFVTAGIARKGAETCSRKVTLIQEALMDHAVAEGNMHYIPVEDVPACLEDNIIVFHSSVKLPDGGTREQYAIRNQEEA